LKKKSYHHKNLREALLEAAIPILDADGVGGLTLRGVAGAAGVSHTAPYRHFANKNALLEAIAVEGYRHLEKGCRDAERRHPDDPLRQFMAAGMAYLYFAVERRAIAHLMFSGALPPETRGEALRTASGSAFAALRDIIENGKRAGIFIDRPADELTLSTLACVHGLAMMVIGGLIQERQWTRRKLQELGKIVAGTLLDGLLREPGPPP
jgi:AcrR family transcriptional regulator